MKRSQSWLLWLQTVQSVASEPAGGGEGLRLRGQIFNGEFLKSRTTKGEGERRLGEVGL